MGYNMANGRWANTLDLNLDPSSQALAADEYSPAIETGDRAVARLTLDVTSVSDGDSLDVTIQTSPDGTNWYTSGTFTQATGVTNERKLFMLDRFVRAHFNVTGFDVEIAATLRGEASR